MTAEGLVQTSWVRAENDEVSNKRAWRQVQEEGKVPGAHPRPTLSLEHPLLSVVTYTAEFYELQLAQCRKETFYPAMKASRLEATQALQAIDRIDHTFAENMGFYCNDIVGLSQLPYEIGAAVPIPGRIAA